MCIKDGRVITEAVGGISPSTDATDQEIIKQAFENGGKPLEADVTLVIKKEISQECCDWLKLSLKDASDAYKNAFANETVAYQYFGHEQAPAETCSFQCIGGVCPKPAPQTESEVKNGVKNGKLGVNCVTQVRDYASTADKIANAPECNLPAPPSDCGTITWWCRKDIVDPVINSPMWWGGGNFDGNVAGCKNIPPGKNCSAVSMENSPCSKLYDVNSGQWKDAVYFVDDSVTMNCSEY